MTRNICPSMVLLFIIFVDPTMSLCLRVCLLIWVSVIKQKSHFIRSICLPHTHSHNFHSKYFICVFISFLCCWTRTCSCASVSISKVWVNWFGCLCLFNLRLLTQNWHQFYNLFVTMVTLILIEISISFRTLEIWFLVSMVRPGQFMNAQINQIVTWHGIYFAEAISFLSAFGRNNQIMKYETNKIP